MSGTEYCNGEHRRHDLALFEQGVGIDSARVCTTSRLEDHNVTVNTAVVPMRFFSRCGVAMYFTFTFYFFTAVLSEWDFSHRIRGCLPQGKPAATESRYPTYGACWVFECFHNPSNSDMDYRIFNVRTDVNACDCARECTDTVRESALKVDRGRKIPCRTGESNLRRRRVGPMLYQPSYIPTQGTRHKSVQIRVCYSIT